MECCEADGRRALRQNSWPNTLIRDGSEAPLQWSGAGIRPTSSSDTRLSAQAGLGRQPVYSNVSFYTAILSVVIILMGLFFLWYLLRRFYPEASRFLLQNPRSSNSSGEIAKSQGVQQVHLDLLPVIKYHTVRSKPHVSQCSHSCASQQGLQSAVATGTPRCRRGPASRLNGDASSGTTVIELAEMSSDQGQHTKATKPHATAAAATLLMTESLASVTKASEPGSTDRPTTVLSTSSSILLARLNVLQGISRSLSADSKLMSRNSSSGGSRVSAAGISAAGSRCSDGADDVCAICYEDYKANDDVKQLPCQHYYHPSCIDAWLATHDTCPLCKAQVVVE